MFPSLSDRSEGGIGPVVAVPPPPYFRPVVGTITSVMNKGVGPAASGNTDAQKAGARFERKTHEYLASLADGDGAFYVRSPMFHFVDGSGSRTCVPDGILYRRGRRPVIFEIKHLHTAHSWWQLRHLYGPVVEYRIGRPVVVEVVAQYDPQVPFPEPVEVIYDPPSWLSEDRDTFGVFRWWPKENVPQGRRVQRGTK